jgi:hypothetical protein
MTSSPGWMSIKIAAISRASVHEEVRSAFLIAKEFSKKV